MKKIFMNTLIALFVSLVIGTYNTAKANFMTVVDNINRTSNAISSVNQAGRGIFGSFEFFQRFKDRRQERREQKQAEKNYNASIQQEYYKTLYEVQELEQRYNSSL